MIIVCPVDNKNACTWISKPEVDNAIGQLFINVLARQCARHHMELATPYIHTHQNHFADLPTRPEKLLPPGEVDGANYQQQIAGYAKYLEEHHTGYEVSDMGERANPTNGRPGFPFFLLFWVLAGACQRHGVCVFLVCNTTTAMGEQ